MRASPQGPAPRRIAPQDLAHVVRYVGFGLVAWLVPERVWLPVSRLIARLIHGAGLSRDNDLMQRIPMVVGEGVRLDPRAVAFERTVSRNLLFMQILKVYHPLGLRQPVALHGREHIDAALGQGRGVILWGSWFQTSTLMEPVAMARAGFALHQLSRHGHGLSQTRFGMRWLNPIYVGSEDRFLAERITIKGASFAALMTLRERTKQNCLVGMRAFHVGHRVFELPFFHGRVRIAPGPVELALATGAVVLPSFAVRNADGVQEVHVEAPIEIDGRGDRHDAVVAAMTAYVRRLEPYVLRYPGQWAGWAHQVRPAASDGDQSVVALPGDV